MQASGSMEQNTSNGLPPSDAIGEWLTPGKALERFEPPPEMVLAAAVEEKRARYGFRISNLGILIKPGCNSEVLHKPDIWDLPGSAPWMLGLINLRSNLVPVFDLRQLFGLPQRDIAAPRLVLVLDQGEKAVGLLIDDFPKPLVDMSFLPNLPQLPEELQAHVRAGYIKGDSVWLEFDHESFFENLVRSEQ
jgi:twitching motility protein PilI